MHTIPTNRNRRLRIARIAACLAFLLIALGTSNASLGHAQSQSKSPGTGDVAQAFVTASRHWNVPLPILLAVGYVESHWEQRDGAPSIDMGYGIMHIVDRPDGTMERSTRLTGLSADSIRQFASANIEAGAATLSDISHRTPNEELSQTVLAQWYPVVAAYSGATDATVRDAYAQEVFRVIREGQRAQLLSGEVVELAPTNAKDVPAPFSQTPNSEDYPPALWVPASGNNYTVGRPYPPLDTVVIHDTEGSYTSAISWFQNPNSGVSAHYVIRSSDGQITQMVREANTGYHGGNWDYNVRSIGIEHEGYMSQPGWYTEAMYQSSSALVRDITEQYGIRKDRAHIIGHYQIPNQSHVDPGPNWNWTYYMSLVRRDTERAALVDNTDPGFSATPPQIDPQHYWWIYGGGYNNSNTYATTSVTNQANSYNSANWITRPQTSGYYDVYAFVPYVDNSTPDTASAKYKVYATNGVQTSVVSQKAITDVGSGSWAHLGKFYFTGGQDARVYLDDWTGETGKNVWFDAVMWIPALGSQPPPTAATSTRTPTNVPSQSTATRTRTRTATPTRTPTNTPTFTPVPTWTPGPCNMRFLDLPDSHWAYAYVGYLFCQGVIGGYLDGTFRPESGSTRGQFAKMLVLGLGWVPYNPVTPTFSDVPPGSTFYTYIEAAFQHGVIGGYNDGTFRPGNAVTRAQAVKMLVLGRGWPLLNPPSPTFPDVLSNHWAYSYVETAFAHSIVGGYSDGTFRPDQLITRAQLAKMVAMAIQATRPKSQAPAPQPTAPPPGVVPPKETASTR